MARHQKSQVTLDRAYEIASEYNPPPFPAKETSSRYTSYVREHGIEDAWELDALRPEVLDRLIRDSIANPLRRGDIRTERDYRRWTASRDAEPYA